MYTQRLYCTFMLIIAFCFAHKVHAMPTLCPEAFNHTLNRLHSANSDNLCELMVGKKAVLFVNTASHCGFNKQFAGLEALHQKYKDQGLLILGFPSNSFLQESSSAEKTANICFKDFGVTFPMFATTPVRGKQANPVFAYLAEKSVSPSWNFNKYLWAAGEVQQFGSKTKPMASELEAAIVKVLTADPPQN